MHVTRFRTLTVTLASTAAVGLLAAGCGGSDDGGGAAGTTTTTAAVTTMATTATTAAAPTSSAGPRCGQWPTSVQGQPQAIAQTEAGGYYVWQDGFGWHLRVRNLTPRSATFSGRITASADFGTITARPDAGGVVTKVEGNTLTFTITGTGGEVADLRGFDATLACEVQQMQFELSVNNGPAPANEIYLGRTSKAIGSTFVLQKAA